MKITAVLQYMFITEVVVNIDNKFGTIFVLDKWRFGGTCIKYFSKIVRYIWYKTPWRLHFHTNFFRNSNGISDRIFPSCTKLFISREGTFGSCLIID